MKVPENKGRGRLRTQIDAIIYFIEKMDFEMVSDILNNNNTYQDMSKEIFIHKLEDLFYTFRELGDTFLFKANKVEGAFNNVNVVALSFVGNVSHNFIDLLFELDSLNNVIDMYEFEDPDSDRELWFQEGRLFLDNEFDFEEDEGYEDADYDDDIDFPN